MEMRIQTMPREETENVNHIPVITETSNQILDTGVNTLQRTLVVKKQVEMDEVDRQLALKQQEFKVRMHVLAQRRAELELKQQETKERAKKFDKFVEDNEIKRRRALKKYQDARKLNTLKQKEVLELTERLEKLQARQQYLNERVSKYKIYEDYLMKILDFLPENYLEYGSDTLVMPILRRHETLSITHQALQQRVTRLAVDLEEGQRRLESLKQEHNNHKLRTTRDLSELQSQWDEVREKNKQREMNLMLHQGQSRHQVEEVGSLLMAVRNLGEQCYFNNYGPLKDMSLSAMMDMIKEYILERVDIEKRASQMTDAGSAMTSVSEVDRRERGSMKHIGSKTQLKSTSKASGKSGMSS
ncbi:uncharacterized protein CCDC197 [Aplochiton taeniatus]